MAGVPVMHAPWALTAKRSLVLGTPKGNGFRGHEEQRAAGPQVACDRGGKRSQQERGAARVQRPAPRREDLLVLGRGGRFKPDDRRQGAGGVATPIRGRCLRRGETVRGTWPV